jgi:hypothetical protein
MAECEQIGALAFALAACHGFVAEKLLRPVVSRGITDEDRILELKASIWTIASKFQDDMILTKN